VWGTGVRADTVSVLEASLHVLSLSRLPKESPHLGGDVSFGADEDVDDRPVVEALGEEIRGDAALEERTGPSSISSAMALKRLSSWMPLTIFSSL
jgi:hypothetical protein